MITDYKAVLFDLDGTLIDSEHFYFSNWQPILFDNFGLSLSFENWINEFAGHTLVDNIQHLKECYNVVTSQEFIWTETRKSYAKSDMKTIQLMPYAREALLRLEAESIRVGLVTSSYRSTVDIVLGHHQLSNYFDFFITRESVQHPKPHPQPYLLGMEKLNLVSKDIFAVEDTITGVTAAKQAGLTCAAVTKQEVERVKVTVKADFVFKNLQELFT